MSKLNERTEKTKSIIHLMVTSLCGRNCPHCCNKQYSLDDVSYVTDEELNECRLLFITGGEPFAFSNPGRVARYYKNLYPNIEKVFVYTNALEMFERLRKDRSTASGIDGFNISIKNGADLYAFEQMYVEMPEIFSENDRIYDFTGNAVLPKSGKMMIINRKWQEDFEAADDSIFRKV